MTTHALLLFALTEFVFSLSPGPAVFLTISQSMRRGFSAGFAVALGVIAINLFYFVLSALGVGAALAASPTVFTSLKYAGAAYLVWTAVKTLIDLHKPSTASEDKEFYDKAPSARSLFGTFAKGALMQASNIKNIVIFMAIIPQFIDTTQATLPQFVSLGIVSVLVELPILAGYAAMASHFSGKIRSNGYAYYLDFASAIILTGIAVSLVFK